MAAEKKRNKELEDVLSKMDNAKRELKALRRQANGEKNSPESHTACG